MGAVDGRARTRLPNEIDMTIVDSGRKSRVAAAARTAGIASASSSPAAPEPAPRGGFAAHTVGEEHFYGHMLSGALAGTTEHCAMFPLDTIKTRMQTATTSAVAGATLGGSTAPSQSSSRWIPRSRLLGPYPVASIRAAASGVVRSHGVAGLYRGVAAVGIGAGPAHALYFATYEHMKRKLITSDDHRHHPFHHALSGVCATVVGDAVQTPVDTVKQRLQMHNSPYVGVWDCVKRTCESQGGVRALYRSYPTTLAMNVPFTAIHFTAYESSKIALRDLTNGGKDVEEESFFVQFTAGGLAGGLAAGITTPLDVVKTRMQTHCEIAECEMSSMAVKGEMQPGSGKGVCAVTGDAVHCKQAAAAAAAANGPGGISAAGGTNGGTNGGAGGGNKVKVASSPYGSSNFWAVLRTIAKEEGAWALTRGLGPRVLFHIPAGAISWGTYEAGKRMLGITGGGHHH